MPDSSVITFITNRSPLFRLDARSNVMWRQDSLSFHHAINVDTAVPAYEAYSKVRKGEGEVSPERLTWAKGLYAQMVARGQS